MYARLAMCAPTARNAASKLPVAASSSRMSATLRFSVSSTPRSTMRAHFRVEHVARQPVLRDAEAHHAAGERAGFEDRHAVAEPAQVVGGGESRRARAHDQHALPGFRFGRREFPAALDRLVAQEALDRIDADGLVQLAAVARALAGVVADAPHDRGQRIVRRSARARPPRSRRSRRGRASPGCLRRPGRRGCTAAAGRDRPAWRCARSPSCWPGSSRRRA